MSAGFTGDKEGGEFFFKKAKRERKEKSETPPDLLTSC